MGVNKILPLLLIAMLACSRKETSVRSAGPVAPPPSPQRTRLVKDALPAGADFDGPGLATAEAAEPTSAQPMIVRTADVRIVVADTSKIVEAITKSAEASGGYVSGSNIWREGELLRAKLTLRVPADKLTSTLAAIRAMAKRVENETVSSEDVSQEYVDLESQLRNLEATEGELRELLKVARVNSKRATEVLEVHQQLTMIRGQIEQAKGRMRYLSQVAAMSAVNVEVVPDAMAKPVVEAGWQPLVIVKDASRALIVLLQEVVTVAIWFTVYVLPITGMLMLAAWLLWKLARRSRASRAASEI
jgi:hypothetical protein